MTGGSRIIAFGPGARNEAPDEEFLLTDEVPRDAPASAPYREDFNDPGAPEPALRRSLRDWLAPVAALVIMAGWTGFYLWAMLPRMLQPSLPADWAEWIAQWASPVLLVAVFWLLVMRTSRRETARFADSARGLSRESALLEGRLVTVNRELSLAREFVASQSRDLEALGRIASERLSANAERLQSLIRENGAHIDAIGSVSSVALDNMEKLRGQLPVIASATKDVTNNIGNAGRNAQTQLEQLIGGFNRLNEFGQASERQVDSLRAAFEAAGTEFTRHCDALGQIADRSFAALHERGDEFRTQIEGHEVEALASMRTRADAMSREFEEAREILDRTEQETLVSLRARISAIRDEGAAIARALRDGEAGAGEAWRTTIEAMTARIAEMDGRLAGLHDTNAERIAHFSGRTDELSRSLESHGDKVASISQTAENAGRVIDSTLARASDRLRDSQAWLSEIEGNLPGVTESSIRLFELIHASADEGRNRLPAALSESEGRLSALEERARLMREAAVAASGAGEALSGSLASTREDLKAISHQVGELHGRLNETASGHTGELIRIRDEIASLDQDSTALAERARGELSSALRELQEASRSAIADIESISAPAVRALADKLAEESAAAIDRAMRSSAAESAGKLEIAAAHAAGVSHEAATQLRDQLLKVNELAGNLEMRVAQARERAEEQVDNDFSRRAALITEALNSCSIDIAKALSSDVADTAWAAYLRGDRGIFTRRAVTLLDNAEGRAISHIYETDQEFRGHVSRFIHDFEAMLRQILSTRDGHSLGVTLLSSDMGKLYVALAQAIERLRA